MSDPGLLVGSGHSLGGALATLAAYDIARLGKEQGVDILLTCITFGAPRTGNHSFVKDFDRHVSKCWNIINGEQQAKAGTSDPSPILVASLHASSVMLEE